MIKMNKNELAEWVHDEIVEERVMLTINIPHAKFKPYQLLIEEEHMEPIVSRIIELTRR